MNQIGSCDKVAFQQHGDEAIARDSYPDGRKWMVELGRVIPSHTLQNLEDEDVEDRQLTVVK